MILKVTNDLSDFTEPGKYCCRPKIIYMKDVSAASLNEGDLCDNFQIFSAERRSERSGYRVLQDSLFPCLYTR